MKEPQTGHQQERPSAVAAAASKINNLAAGDTFVTDTPNSANVAIHYGREAELPGADREAQEISMLTLHLLQSALVLVNTRLVDRVLSEPDWAARLTEHDLRALTPLFWSNVALHGTFQLDLNTRLDYDSGPPALALAGPA